MSIASAQPVTIVIVARNAATTIARAIRSALDAGAQRILLVDDHSTDQTLARAQAAGGHALRVVQPPAHRSVAYARQTALDALDSRYGIWLDADDELLPGRIERMLAALEDDAADLVFDPVLLVDGATGTTRQTLPLPGFLRRPGGIWRSFERNWIPMLAGGFATDFARSIGFDATFDNAEDYDFLLRSIAAGAHIRLLDEPGYRYYHYPDSLSRDLNAARAQVQRTQARFDSAQLADWLVAAGMPSAERAFVQAARAMILDDHAAVTMHCRTLCGKADTITPYARSADWCGRFLQAASSLVCADYRQALAVLEELAAESSAREVHNNLGVALWHAGQRERAARQFAELRRRCPDYLDAARNWRQLTSSAAGTAAITAVTLHPLRTLPSRRDYVLDTPNPATSTRPD